MEPTHEQAQAAFGASTPARSRPSVLGYWLGGALIAAGVAGAVAWFVAGLVGFSGAVDRLQRVPLPGVANVRLQEGRQAVYYERPDVGSATGAEGSADPPPPRVRVQVTPAAGGAPLRVGPHSGSVSYSAGGRRGRSVAGFDVPRTGTYRITTATVDGRGAPAQVAIGPGVGRRIVRTLIGACVVFLLGGAAGTVVVILTHQRRSRTRAV